MKYRVLAGAVLIGACVVFLGNCSKPRMTVTASPLDVDPGGTVRVSERISMTDAQLRYKFGAPAGSFNFWRA